MPSFSGCSPAPVSGPSQGIQPFPKLLQYIPFSETSPIYTLLQICRFSGITPAWVLFHVIHPFRIRQSFRIRPLLLGSPVGHNSWQKTCSYMDSLHGLQLPSVSVVCLPHLPILHACCNLGLFADIILTLCWSIYLEKARLSIIFVNIITFCWRNKGNESCVMTKIFITV